MRKFIYLSASIIYLFTVNTSTAQNVIWGMTSNGGSKNGGGNIFSVNPDGTGFQERIAFLADGQTPYSQQSVSEKSTSILIKQWDVSHLPAGIYLLKVQTAKRQFTKTIIKQ